MKFKLSTKSPNKITARERWTLSDSVVIITKKWRMGHLFLRERPIFSKHYSPTVGINVNAEFEPLHHSFKTCETRYEYRNVGLGEQELIEKIYSDSMGEGLEQLGWKNTKFQCWFYGNFKVDEI